MRYVVFFAHIFVSRDWERFGCPFFEEHGYDVLPVEVIDLIRPDQREKLVSETYQSVGAALKIHNIDEFEYFISTLGDDDLLINAIPLSPETAPLFWLFNKYKLKYVALSLNKHPINHLRNMPKINNFKKFFARLYNDLFEILYAMKVLMIWKYSVAYNWKKIPEPWIWLDAGSRNNIINLSAPKLNKTKRIPVHSLDVEICKKLESGVIAKEIVSHNSIAVFLDDGFLGCPEFAFHNMDVPATPEIYAESLNRFFELVEQKFDVEVVIAAHQKSRDEDLMRFLGTRKIYRGKTCELTHGSQFVIASCSTSVSFAIYFEKPVIIITTCELESDTYIAPLIANLSTYLKNERINIDDLNPSFEKPTINEKVYKTYRHEFLCQKNINIDSIWSELERHFAMELNPVNINGENDVVR